MNKAVWRKKLAKLKRNIRNATRARMRQAVNFALADEPDIYEHPDVEVYDAEPKADIHHRIEQKYNEPPKKFDKDKIIKVGLLVLGAVVIFKLGKRAGRIAMNKVWTREVDQFFDSVIFKRARVFIDHPNGKSYELMSKLVTD